MKFRKIAVLCFCSVMCQMCFGASDVKNNIASEREVQKPDGHQVSADINTDEYKQELEDFKKLQMDNIRLKLQAENEKLSQQAGTNGGAVKLIYVYSTSAQDRVAEVLGGGEGLREVRVGDLLTDGYTVQEIGKDYILSVSGDGKEKLLKLLSPGQG